MFKAELVEKIRSLLEENGCHIVNHGINSNKKLLIEIGSNVTEGELDDSDTNEIVGAGVNYSIPYWDPYAAMMQAWEASNKKRK